jgi:hypothetical protein
MVIDMPSRNILATPIPLCIIFCSALLLCCKSTSRDTKLDASLAAKTVSQRDLFEAQWLHRPLLGGSSKTIAEQSWHFPAPDAMSVEKSVYVSGDPSLDGAAGYIRDFIRSRQRTKDLDVFSDPNATPYHLRMIIKGLKSEILEGHSYWEMIYLTLNLTDSGMSTETEGLAKIPDCEYYYYHTGGGLRTAMKQPHKVFQFTVDISGRYKTGGKPDDMNGYDIDFEPMYNSELDNYAGFIQMKVVQLFKGRISKEFNAVTGCPEGRVK